MAMDVGEGGFTGAAVIIDPAVASSWDATNERRGSRWEMGPAWMWAGEDGASCCFMKYRSFPLPPARSLVLSFCLRFWNHT